MFETARIRVARRHFGLLSISLLMHSAIIIAVIAASIASTRLPIQPPKELLPLFVAPPLPLSAGTPIPISRPKPVAAVPRGPVAPPAVAPPTIPDATVPAEPAASSSVPGPASTGEVGVPGGVQGGIPPTDSQTAAAAPDAAGPLVVGGNVKAPVVLRRVEPVYPRAALMARISGWVKVQCTIDKTGHIRDVHVVNSSFGAFEQPAVDAVQQWLFAPGSLNGQPVDTIFELTVNFQMLR